MKRILYILISFFCLALTASGQTLTENGQTPDAPNKPVKVAVVLSGGGAKGMAHIGVLKVLERAGIPINIITGTSMGSIVGGMYACGHHADELDSVVRAQDWSFVLSDREDLRHQSLREREKQNTYAYSSGLSFSKKRNSEGGGFILGKNIASLFDAYTAPYNDSIDFNTLPIPFACVATDVVDYSEKVYHRGVLSRAMRASMSIPAAFAPVRKDSMVLVDGGLVNNFPADVAKEMGATYIIGVSVQSELKKASELNSTSSILLQVIDHNCKRKLEENLKITDLLIQVNTKGYSSASFSNNAVDTLIRRGEEAAMQHWDEIIALRDKLGITPKDTTAFTITHTLPLTKTRYQIRELEFQHMTKSDESYIRKKFRLHVGDSIDMERADIIATSIRQDTYYRSASFRIQNNPNEASAKVLFIAGPRRGKQLNIGVRFDNEEAVALQANAELPIYTKVPMDMEMTVRLGKRMMARADWSLHPLSFFRPTLSYIFRNNDIDFYDYGDKAYSMNYNQHTVKLTLFNFNVRNFNISIGANWDYYDYHSMLIDRLPEHIADGTTEDKGMVSYEGKVWYDSEDDWHFPNRGARFLAKYAYHSDNFITLDGKVGIREYGGMWRMTFPLNSNFSIQPMLYGRLVFTDNVPFVISNVMGGEWHGPYFEQQLPFPGVGNLQLAWDKMLACQLQAQYKPTSNNVILMRFGAGQDAQELKVIFKKKTMLGGSLSYYFKTMFGPMGGSIGYSNLTKKFYYYVNLGFVF